MSKKETHAESLDKRIQAFKDKEEASRRQMRSLIGPSANVAVEFVAGVATGGLLGYGLDQWFDTTPLWFFVCLVCGMVASMVTIYRTNNDDSES